MLNLFASKGGLETYSNPTQLIQKVFKFFYVLGTTCTYQKYRNYLISGAESASPPLHTYIPLIEYPLTDCHTVPTKTVSLLSISTTLAVDGIWSLLINYNLMSIVCTFYFKANQ